MQNLSGGTIVFGPAYWVHPGINFFGELKLYLAVLVRTDPHPAHTKNYAA